MNARIFEANASKVFHGPGVETRCTLGKAGVIPAEEKREGDNKSPLGDWPMRSVFYRPDRVSPPETHLPVSPLTPHDGWCDDPKAGVRYTIGMSCCRRPGLARNCGERTMSTTLSLFSDTMTTRPSQVLAVRSSCTLCVLIYLARKAASHLEKTTFAACSLNHALGMLSESLSDPAFRLVSGVRRTWRCRPEHASHPS